MIPEHTALDARAGRRSGYLGLLLVFFIWGSNYVVSKHALATIPPLTLLLFRELVSIAALALMMRGRYLKPVRRQDAPCFLILGGLGYGASIALLLIGTRRLDASLASLINAMSPVAITLLATVFLSERLTFRKTASLAFSIAGVAVIMGRGSRTVDPLGVLACCAAVLLWSTASIAIRRISTEYHPLQISLYGMIVAIAVVLPASLVELHSQPVSFTVPGLLSVLYLAIVCTAIAHSLWNRSLSLLDAGTCAMFYPLQPLISAALGVLLLHETLTLRFISGCLLVSVGIVIALVRFRERPSAVLPRSG